MSQIIKSDISYEMKYRYLDYAMDVIEDRALPDVRDGLKPIHRRILFASYELGLMPEKPYRKCARIVGDVLGKYHPHGDSAAFGALVRMAQDFNLRRILIDGFGNFGSVDGDPAAAMRYVEARLSKIAMEMFRDINKNTVDFIPNFDGQEQEPTVLPSKFPNLLVNGSSGIAVGMATNIPPHNLTNVIDCIAYQLDNPNCNIEELAKIIVAPDMPTGACIINPQDMLEMYQTGKGSIIIRSKYHIESNEKTKNIVFTEIPYQANKAKICEVIGNLITEKDPILKNLVDIRDESDRDGMRIVVELKKSDNVNNVLAQLFKKTLLQDTFSATFRAIADGLPKVLNLKQINNYYVNHQKEVISRRTRFDLDKCNKRLHIVNGLMKAIENLDKTIALIRSSKSNKEAKDKLCEFLAIDENQAQSILDMKLQKLTGLEIETFIEEYKELQNTIIYLESILNNESKLLELLKTELLEIKEKYGDERRTQLVYENNIKEISTTDLIEDYNTKLFLTDGQWLKKIPLTSLRGKGVDEQKLKDGDIITQEVESSNKSVIMCFSNKGNRYKLNAYDIDDAKPNTLGEYIPNLLTLEQDEKIIKIVSLEDESKAKGYILSVFSNGKISKVDIKSFISANKKLQNCYSTESELFDIEYIQTDVDVLMISQEGKSLIVNSQDIGSKQSRNSQGNQAMNLGESEDNKVVSCMINPSQNLNFTITTEKGKNKEFRLDDIAETGRKNEERNLYTYVKGRARNTGSFLINLRSTNDSVKEVKYE